MLQACASLGILLNADPDLGGLGTEMLLLLVCGPHLE